jgi:hypothetical protein
LFFSWLQTKAIQILIMTKKIEYTPYHHIHLGMRGVGKTAEMKSFIKKVVKSKEKNKEPYRVLIIDPLLELEDIAVEVPIQKINSRSNGVFILKYKKTVPNIPEFIKQATHAVESFINGTLIIDNVDFFRSDPRFKYALASLSSSSRNRNVNTYFACQRPDSLSGQNYSVCTVATFSRLQFAPCGFFYNRELVDLAVDCRKHKVMVDYSELSKKYKRLPTINKHGRKLELLQKVQVDFVTNKIMGIPEDIFCHTVKIKASENIDTNRIAGLLKMAENITRLSEYF